MRRSCAPFGYNQSLLNGGVAHESGDFQLVFSHQGPHRAFFDDDLRGALLTLPIPGSNVSSENSRLMQ